MSDELPDWVVGEIQTVKFRKRTKALNGTGYVLELYAADGKADIQLDEPVEDGRHIITADLTDGVGADALERGPLYRFALRQHKAPLSKKTAEYLRAERGVEMSAIYRFDLDAADMIDADGDADDDDDDDDGADGL